MLDFDADPALQSATVFETAARTTVDPDHNELRFHTRGNASCCLARGATAAWLYGLPAVGGAHRAAYRPPPAIGDSLPHAEVRGVAPDRQRVLEGKSVDEGVELDGCRTHKQKKNK